jgi:hypothetical protein
MRINTILLASAAACLLATGALAQSMSGGNAMTMQSGTSIFSRQNMAMMIVDRDKATMGMTDEQKASARKEEMAKDGGETPDQRMARKQRYDSEWAKLTPVEQSSAMDKLDAQMKARAAAMSAQPAK